MSLCCFGVISKLTFTPIDAEYVLLRTEVIIPISRALDPAETAPLMCAGVTLFHTIRRLKIIAGETVVIQGLGGLGHLGVQYSKAMGYNTVALGRGAAWRGL